MSVPSPSPTFPASSRTEVFGRYLDYVRAWVTAKVEALPAVPSVTPPARTGHPPPSWIALTASRMTDTKR